MLLVQPTLGEDPDSSAVTENFICFRLRAQPIFFGQGALGTRPPRGTICNNRSLFWRDDSLMLKVNLGCRGWIYGSSHGHPVTADGIFNLLI